MNKHHGSCHCGAVTFSFEGDITELTTCDCSLCVKKNAVMTKVHESKFALLSGEENLTEYNWNTNIARHFFCKVCGIYTFHKKRALPDHYGVNVFCLDGFDAQTVKIRATEGISMSVNPACARDVWPGPRQQQ